MILFPAIDLKEGQCVRLAQGDMTRATVFNDDPAKQARAFERQGFEYLHVVDLDGAFAGAPRNASAVEAILAALKIPVQLGGGIREMRTIALTLVWPVDNEWTSRTTPRPRMTASRTVRIRRGLLVPDWGPSSPSSDNRCPRGAKRSVTTGESFLHILGRVWGSSRKS